MKEIVAQEIFGTPYMTQSAEVTDRERTYCRRAMGANVRAEDYRGASADEKEAHDELIERLDNDVE